MLDHQVIRSCAAECLVDLAEPLCLKTRADGIHDRALFAFDNVGIIGHAARNDVLSLEEVYVVVVDAYVKDVFCNVIHDCCCLLPAHPPLLPALPPFSIFFAFFPFLH